VTLSVNNVAATALLLYGYSFYYDTVVAGVPVAVALIAVPTHTINTQPTITPTTFNLITVNDVVIFSHTKPIQAGMSLLFQVKVGTDANLTIGSGCDWVDTIVPIVCTAASTTLSATIGYFITLKNAASAVVDTLYFSTIGNANPMPISFDFKYYYFDLTDIAGTRIMSGASMKVNSTLIPTISSAGASFYYDNQVSFASSIIVYLSVSTTTILYN
jgi:hypothetical protein